ncbi:hypothetical protein CC80DRAFT_557482 [Byssothecium circinans]|uniref:Uncharacterized protein n=1 Tax=Byssothecium circinans TaxID=147558 RepID=A0A6A5UFC4_9PLEO|nr:hypothetical protein CC80DRAFT_557482 [Byssothecium circinans]
MASITLGQPPPGLMSNFNNPETLKNSGEAAMSSCMVLGGIFIALRIYVKVFITKMYGWDDFWCVMAYICVVAHDAVSITSNFEFFIDLPKQTARLVMGLGKGRLLGAHNWDIKTSDITKSSL